MNAKWGKAMKQARRIRTSKDKRRSVHTWAKHVRDALGADTVTEKRAA